MIVFQRRLLFSGTPEAQSFPERGVECWNVREVPSLDLRGVLPLHSDWRELSCRKIRYHTSVPFEEARGPFDWGLEVEGTLEFLWRSGSRTIDYRRNSRCDSEILRYWLLHTFVPLVLELERIYRLLHVGAVEVSGKAMLFSAFSGGGKSTLTDHFLREGHPLLSDDSLGIRSDGAGGWYAVPSYPYCRPYRQAESLGKRIRNFASVPLPVGAVYLLERSDPAQAISIEAVEGIKKYEALLHSSFIDFDFMTRERFDFFSSMAREIPLYRVRYPDGREHLPALYQRLTGHFREHSVSPTVP